MSLTRLNDQFNIDLEGIAFGMLSETGAVVRCLVTEAAIRDAMKGNPTQKEREEWFRAHRGDVEEVASAMFDEGRLQSDGTIRVDTRELNPDQFS
jgi:Protein of unknown function (DUF1488)